MNFLERLWRISDEIFAWKGWHVGKWITGVLIITLIIFLILIYYGFSAPIALPLFDVHVPS